MHVLLILLHTDVLYIDAKHVNNQFYKTGDLVPFVKIYVSSTDYNINLPLAPEFSRNYVHIDNLESVIDNIAVIKKFK